MVFGIIMLVLAALIFLACIIYSFIEEDIEGVFLGLILSLLPAFIGSCSIMGEKEQDKMENAYSEVVQTVDTLPSQAVMNEDYNCHLITAELMAINGFTENEGQYDLGYNFIYDINEECIFYKYDGSWEVQYIKIFDPIVYMEEIINLYWIMGVERAIQVTNHNK